MPKGVIQSAPPAGSVLAALATAQIFPQLPPSNNAPPQPNACVLNIPGSGRLEQKKFSVIASGNLVTVNNAYTVVFSLFGAIVAPVGANSLVPGDWTLLKAIAAVTPGVTTYVPWWVEADLSFDSLGGELQGLISAQAGNLAYAAPTALAATLSGINGTGFPITQAGTVVPPTEPAFALAIGVTFSTGSASNIANLASFTCSD